MKITKTRKYLTQLLRPCVTPALLLLAMALPARAGVALKLEYDGIPGTAVINLTTNAIFPNGPTYSSVLASGLEEPANFADNFGAWTRGFIEAPQTGAYVFWIASDDDGEFWLSTDYTPAHLVKIAENVGAVAQYDYYLKPAQQSAPVPLVAGQKYYFEMLHKEGGAIDHCSIAWQLPDGTFQKVVPSARLWPFPVNLYDASYPPITEGPSILTSYVGALVDQLDPSGTTSAQDGQPLDLTVTIEASQPAYVQWYSNSVAIPGANLASYHIPRVTMAMNGAVYSVTVTNSIAPAASATTTLSVMSDVVPPILVDALNLGNPAGDIAVVFSESVDPTSATAVGHYSLNNGASVVSAVMSTNPAVVLLRVAGMTPGTAYTLTVQNVQDLASTPNTLSPNPSSVLLEQNLHTWFRLDEATGTVAADSSGHGRNGTLTNGMMPGYTGKVQAATKFDGISGYIQAQPSADDFSTNGMTVAVWAYPQDNLENWARFLDYAVGAFSDDILFARSGTSPDLTFEVYNGTSSGGKVTAIGAIALRQWQHFAVTMDAGGNVTLYKNGVAITNGYTAVPNPVLRTNNFIGHSNMPQDGYYFGKMDDFRIYTRVLDPAAIAALAGGGGADDSSLPSVSVTATVPTTALHNTPPGVFTLTRTGSTAAPLTVLYTLGGTATNGVTYTNLSGSVTIPAGTNAALVFVTPIDFAFTQLQETAILTLAGNANYTIANADSGTVVIQNNNVAPAAKLATAENGFGANTNTVDVWFSAAVTQPSATTLSNYQLVNAGGATITSATLSANRNLRVVLTLSAPVPTNAFLIVTNVLDQGGNTASNQVPIFCRAESINIVANVYHSGIAVTRPMCFGYVSDGVVNNTANSGTGFDTFSGAANNQTHFGGMTYPCDQDFQVIKVDLGQQFNDGGDWQAQPFVYILKNPVDTGSTRPETDPNNWVRVPAVLISGSQFQTAVDVNPSPNTPIVFDLSGLPASQRHGYGWAVGGVLGNGTTRFLSFSELRAYGYTGPTNVLGVQGQPKDLSVTEGQRGAFAWNPTNSMGTSFTYQWYQNGASIMGATDMAYNIPAAALGDSGQTFSVVTTPSGGLLSWTSRVATLTVQARTAAPSVVAANLDATNLLIDVWFDEAVEGNTAQTLGNYSLNDSGLSLVGATLHANGYCVTLNYSGTPSVPNLTVTVSGVQDLVGRTMSSQTTAVLPLCWPVVNVVANQYQQGRVTASMDSTNGLIVNATGDGNVWATFEGSKDPVASDFVGLRYDQPQVFGVIKVDLGWQFGDGGDWELQPYVYLLKNPIDSNQAYPEKDPADWVAVPATLISGNVFNSSVDGPAGVPVNTPIAFDLSHLPLSQRTGYGWAVGGVPANAAAHFLSITELRAFGSAAATYSLAGAPQVLIDLPGSVVQPVGTPLRLQVYATGTQPMTYQWKRNGVNLSDGGFISGAHTSTLTLSEALASDAGSYQLFLTNSAGYGQSAACTVSLTRIQPNNGAGWSLNGADLSGTRLPVINGNMVTLTDGLGNEASSSFLTSPQYVGAFVASYTYQDVGGNGADGCAFVLQNDPRGPAALGGGGGQLGYGGLTNSVALEFNIYSGNKASATSSGFAFRTNGLTGTPYADCTPVNPASGNPINVWVHYDGATAFITLQDTVTAAVFTTNYTANIPALVGGTNTAYVGLTGASGGVASKQQISNFSFVSIPTLTASVVSPGVLQLSWPATAGGVVLQKTPSLSAPNWATVNAPVNLVNGQNQVQVSTLTGNGFYALRLP